MFPTLCSTTCSGDVQVYLPSDKRLRTLQAPCQANRCRFFSGKVIERTVNSIAATASDATTTPRVIESQPVSHLVHKCHMGVQGASMVGSK